MNTRELRKDEIALYRVDKDNYIVLRKQRIDKLIDQKIIIERYIVQWWSERTKYYWSNYDMSYIQAMKLFCEKITNNKMRDYEIEP